MIKGLVVSVVLFALVAGVLVAMTGLAGWPAVTVVLLGAPFPVIGVILGYAATRIRTRRFLKLFGLGVVLVYATALASAAAMVLLDGSGKIPLGEMSTSIFFLGSVGFVLYGALTLPLLSLGVFAIERWTR